MIEWVPSRTGRPLTVALALEGRAKERCFVEQLVRQWQSPAGHPSPSSSTSLSASPLGIEHSALTSSPAQLRGRHSNYIHFTERESQNLRNEVICPSTQLVSNKTWIQTQIFPQWHTGPEELCACFVHFSFCFCFGFLLSFQGLNRVYLLD